MSRAARCLNTSLRSLTQPKSPSTLFPQRALTPGGRAYGQAAFRQREHSYDDRVQTRPHRSRESRPAAEEERMSSERMREREQEDAAEAEETAAKVSAFEEYLNRLLYPLQFPQELGQRVLTHGSHRLARKGHNAGLSFIGRRVLSTYLLLFLQSSRNLSPTDDIEDIALSTLHTNLLGEHVGHAWGVGRAVVWQPSIPSAKSLRDKTDLEVLRSAGLYKIQGETVQAIMGAVYHQHGASVAHRVFHTRVLPHLLVKGGLPIAFHEDVKSISARLGGTEGSSPLTDEVESEKVSSS